MDLPLVAGPRDGDVVRVNLLAPYELDCWPRFWSHEVMKAGGRAIHVDILVGQARAVYRLDAEKGVYRFAYWPKPSD